MTPPVDEGSVGPVAMHALEAIERRDYALGIGLALMVVTFIVGRVATSKLLLPKEYTSTVLLGSAVLGGFGAALAAGVPPGRAALAFVACSSTAIAFWEGVAKHVVKFWSWKKQRKRSVPPRKFPTILCIGIAVLFVSPRARAGERLAPGIVLTRPDGTQVRIGYETVLLDDEDVARLDGLLQELAECRESRDDCKREHAKPRSDRMWVVLATIAGAFVAGFCAQQQVKVTAETVEPP